MALPTVAVAFIAHDQNGNPVAGARVQARLDQTEIYQGFVAPEVVEATADATGAVSLDLWPNELGVAGSAYQVRAWNPDTGKKFLDARAVVPNANCNLYQILVQEPYPPIDASERALIDAQAAALSAQEDRVQTGLDRIQTGEDRVQTGLDRVQTGDDRVQTGEDRVQTGLDRAAAETALASITNVGEIAASLDAINTTADNLTAINTTVENLAAILAAPTEASNADSSATLSSEKALEASNSAQSASTSAITATTQASLATSAKTAAEAARDAAHLAAGVYATTAAGLAATTNGQYFNVPASSANDSLILYLNSSGTAVEIKRYPSAEKLTPLLSIAPPEYAWALVDENGVASFGVLNDGTLRASKILADEASATRQKLGTDSVISGSPAGYVWALVDQYGNAALAVRHDGAVLVNDLLATTINGVRSKRITDLAGVQPGNYSAEINHVISYGQSLSLGVGGTQNDLQTTSQDYDSLMFTAGVRAYEGPGTVAQNHAAFVPLVESYNASQGETPIGQSAAMIKKLILEENGIPHTTQSYKLLGSACGVSATAIANLGRGSTGYTRLTNALTYGVANAAAMSAPYAVQTVYWSQGEQDYTNGTSYAAYLAALESLYQALNTDIKSASGQPNDIKMISYQCFLEGSSPATVALAQLQASKNNPNIIIACPNYHIDHIPGNVHLNGAGYGMLGAYFGLVYKRVIVDGLAWKPLSPLSVTRQGSIAAIKFHVPVRPLELDATAFAAQANSGFSMIDAGGAAIAITSVSIIGPDTVKIVAAAPLTAGCKIRYGFSGGGNLRDSQGYEIFVQQRARRPLHNWCVAFEETIS